MDTDRNSPDSRRLSRKDHPFDRSGKWQIVFVAGKGRLTPAAIALSRQGLSLNTELARRSGARPALRRWRSAQIAAVRLRLHDCALEKPASKHRFRHARDTRGAARRPFSRFGPVVVITPEFA